MKARNITLFARGLKFPEGPAFDRRGNLFAVNIDSADISRISPDGKVETFVNTGGVPNGARFHANGDLYVADRVKGIIAISPQGQIHTIVDNYEGKAFNGPNDLIFDYDGNLYFTDPHGSHVENPIGKVYRVSVAGEISLLAEGLAYPNGLVISANGSDLLVALTGKNRVNRYVVDSQGIPIRRTIFVQLSGGWGPDGMALDVDGNLYIAHVGEGYILILNKDGDLLERIPVGGNRPTNLTFGGPERKSLYITEADTGSVFRVDVETPGLPLFG